MYYLGRYMIKIDDLGGIWLPGVSGDGSCGVFPDQIGETHALAVLEVRDAIYSGCALYFRRPTVAA